MEIDPSPPVNLKRALPSPGSGNGLPGQRRLAINRTKTGCVTCRSRKVKCDETKPVCTHCHKGGRICSWPAPESSRRPRGSRRPNLTACDGCREKKLKCIGNVQDACEKCHNRGIECVRTQREYASVASQNPSSPSYLSENASAGATLPPEPPEYGEPSLDAADSPHSTAQAPPLKYPAPPTRLPPIRELEELIQLYFSSVHHFGFFAFIHSLHFNRLLARGKAPRELTLIMIASAMRFAANPTKENLAKADAWADEAIRGTLSRIYQGFGIIQLMTLLLAQHYDLNRGNFTSAWLLGSHCTRMMQMMSLQTFDRTYNSNITTSLHLSSLISCEALRRVAWCTFYLDTIIDGGRYGFHTIDENSYRVQLPCDQASFLGNEEVRTEPLFNNLSNSEIPTTSNLDMSAYLLRTAAARRRALHFAFRASYREQSVEKSTAELLELEAHVEEIVAALPKRFHFNTDNLTLHHDRLLTFILLHILRHNLFIVVGRAALLIYGRDDTDRIDLIRQWRHNRIAHAQAVAGVVHEGLRAEIIFDPQIGVHAYVSLEILLFEPRRLATSDSSIDPNENELIKKISYLLAVIREIALRSEFVRQLHIEAVHRLLQCNCTNLLNEADLSNFQSEYRFVGQDAAEYDFRDFRWAKLERLRRGARSAVSTVRDEALLEYVVDGESVAPSPTISPRPDALDALDVRHSHAHTLLRVNEGIPSAHIHNDIPNLPDAQGPASLLHLQNEIPLGGTVTEPEGVDQAFSLDWLWLLDESGNPGYHTAHPNSFWSHLQ